MNEIQHHGIKGMKLSVANLATTTIAAGGTAVNAILGAKNLSRKTRDLEHIMLIKNVGDKI